MSNEGSKDKKKWTADTHPLKKWVFVGKAQLALMGGLVTRSICKNRGTTTTSCSCRSLRGDLLKLSLATLGSLKAATQWRRDLIARRTYNVSSQIVNKKPLLLIFHRSWKRWTKNNKEQANKWDLEWYHSSLNSQTITKGWCGNGDDEWLIDSGEKHSKVKWKNKQQRNLCRNNN